MEGTSNKTIVSFFAEKTSDVVKIIFVGVFPSNYVIRFISFHSIMTESVALFFLSKLSTIYILTNRTIIYIYIYIYDNHKTLISHHGCSCYLVITGQKEQTIFCITFRHFPSSDASL